MQKPNYTQVANDFIDRIMRECRGSEVKVALAIFRKTIGWHKETAEAIPYSQIRELTGLTNNRTINDAIENLEKRGVIKVTKPEGRDATGGKFHTWLYELNIEPGEKNASDDKEESEPGVESTPGPGAESTPGPGVQSTPSKDRGNKEKKALGPKDRINAVKEALAFLPDDTLPEKDTRFLTRNQHHATLNDSHLQWLADIEERVEKAQRERMPPATGPGHPPKPELTEEQREETVRCLEAQHEMGRLLKVPHYTVKNECERRGIYYEFTDPDGSLAEIRKAVEQPEFQSQIEFPRIPERENYEHMEEINEA